MEPRIQYAQTKDGVSIAFWTLGEGMPLVHMPLLFSHIQLEWQLPECRRWYERLAEKWRVVRYDSRGMGLSQRDVDMAYNPLEAAVQDVDAVARRLALPRFVLFGLTHSGPAAISYAVRHPDEVSHLLLWCAYAQASGFSRAPNVQAVRALMDKDWAFYAEAAAHALLGWSEGEPARRYAALIRESITPEALQAVIPAISELDVAALLPEVRVPTLVLHRRGYLDVNVARGLASRIADARLALLEGASGAPYLGDTEAVAVAIDEFLSEGEEGAAEAEAPEPSAFRTVFFTDVEGSTALTQRLGDARARELLRQHERIVREALKAHGGSELKTMGDGFMASFSSATRALECAIAMQRTFAAHNESAEEPILVRVGLNAGEPIAEDEDLFGTAVIAAARIAAQARGGEILASDVVRQLVAGKQFRFSGRGRTALKGFDEAVEVYEVAWQEE
jgi:class 3 adenylate cyclase